MNGFLAKHSHVRSVAYTVLEAAGELKPVREQGGRDYWR